MGGVLLLASRSGETPEIDLVQNTTIGRILEMPAALRVGAPAQFGLERSENRFGLVLQLRCAQAFLYGNYVSSHAEHMAKWLVLYYFIYITRSLDVRCKNPSL